MVMTDKREIIEFLLTSEEYMQYIMDNGKSEEVTICNGDTMIEAMENHYLFKEFLTGYGRDLVSFYIETK